MRTQSWVLSPKEDVLLEVVSQTRIEVNENSLVRSCPHHTNQTVLGVFMSPESAKTALGKMARKWEAVLLVS